MYMYFNVTGLEDLQYFLMWESRLGNQTDVRSFHAKHKNCSGNIQALSIDQMFSKVRSDQQEVFVVRYKTHRENGGEKSYLKSGKASELDV